MKKWLKWLLITIGVIAIGTIIFFIVKQSLREEAELTFPDTVIIHNTTDLELDRIAKALTHHVFEYDTMEVMFINMPKHLEEVGDIDLLGFINKNPFEEKKYMIHLSSKVTSVNLKKVLAHEFLHLKQMEDKKLVQFPPDDLMAIWDGDTIDYKKVSYEKRPHEIEAHKLDNSVNQQLEKVLYK